MGALAQDVVRRRPHQVRSRNRLRAPRQRERPGDEAQVGSEQCNVRHPARQIGAARDKGPVISFEMKGAHPHDVATVIDRAGIAVRAGTHCVMPLLERFNVTATCRASFGMYNTREEVDHLAQALIKARELFS